MKRIHFHALVLLLLVAGLVGCDHSTKQLAQEGLRNQEDLPIISGVVDLAYRENRGVGFNVLRSVPYEIRHPLAIGVSLIVLPFISVFWFLRRRERWPMHVAFALIVGGALGNLIDRVSQGYVIDFIHVHYWPVFNMADIYLTCGAILLAIGISRTSRAELLETAKT